MALCDLLELLHMGFESWLENEIYYVFLELINFTNKIILKKIQNWYLSHKKYSKTSENLGKFFRDTLEYNEPK